MQGKSNRKSVYLRLSRGEAYLLKDDLKKLGHEGEAHFNKQKRHDLICLLEAILDHNSYSY